MTKNKKKRNPPEILLQCINRIKIKRKAKACFKTVMMKIKTIKNKNLLIKKKKVSNKKNLCQVLVQKRLQAYLKIPMMMNLFKKPISQRRRKFLNPLMYQLQLNQAQKQKSYLKKKRMKPIIKNQFFLSNSSLSNSSNKLLLNLLKLWLPKNNKEPII